MRCSYPNISSEEYSKIFWIFLSSLVFVFLFKAPTPPQQLWQSHCALQQNKTLRMHLTRYSLTSLIKMHCPPSTYSKTTNLKRVDINIFGKLVVQFKNCPFFKHESLCRYYSKQRMGPTYGPYWNVVLLLQTL